MLKIETIPTVRFDGQKPGTSGLRKSVKVFTQPHYTENFIQSILTAGLGDSLANCSLIVGGDGRYYCKEAVAIIIRICAANKVVVLLSLTGSWPRIGFNVVVLLARFQS